MAFVRWIKDPFCYKFSEKLVTEWDTTRKLEHNFSHVLTNMKIIWKFSEKLVTEWDTTRKLEHNFSHVLTNMKIIWKYETNLDVINPSVYISCNVFRRVGGVSPGNLEEMQSFCFFIVCVEQLRRFYCASILSTSIMRMWMAYSYPSV